MAAATVVAATAVSIAEAMSISAVAGISGTAIGTPTASGKPGAVAASIARVRSGDGRWPSLLHGDPMIADFLSAGTCPPTTRAVRSPRGLRRRQRPLSAAGEGIFGSVR